MSPTLPHGYADVPCTQLYDSDLKSEYDLRFGLAIREFRAVRLTMSAGNGFCLMRKFWPTSKNMA
jgi:hypothetical protein